MPHGGAGGGGQGGIRQRGSQIHRDIRNIVVGKEAGRLRGIPHDSYIWELNNWVGCDTREQI